VTFGIETGVCFVFAIVLKWQNFCCHGHYFKNAC